MIRRVTQSFNNRDFGVNLIKSKYVIYPLSASFSLFRSLSASFALFRLLSPLSTSFTLFRLFRPLSASFTSFNLFRPLSLSFALFRPLSLSFSLFHPFNHPLISQATLDPKDLYNPKQEFYSDLIFVFNKCQEQMFSLSNSFRV